MSEDYRTSTSVWHCIICTALLRRQMSPRKSHIIH